MIHNIVPRAARMRVCTTPPCLLHLLLAAIHYVPQSLKHQSLPRWGRIHHRKTECYEAMRRAHTNTCGRSVCGSAAAVAREKMINEHVSLYHPTHAYFSCLQLSELQQKKNAQTLGGAISAPLRRNSNSTLLHEGCIFTPCDRY